MVKKEDAIESYEGIFNQVWERVVVTLGAITVAALWRRAIKRTITDCSLLEGLIVTNNGFDLSSLKKTLTSDQQEKLCDMFEQVMLSFFELLSELTGEMIVDQFYKKKILEEIQVKRM